MKAILTAAVAAAIAALLPACSDTQPAAQALRPVNTVQVRYGSARETHRYFASVASRHEVDQAFRVGGKVIERKVELGQSVKAGEVLALLDDQDYRLAEDAARQRLDAATARANQAESDWQRLQALKLDGSVSESDEEHARSNLSMARAAATAEARQLDLARNQAQYTVLRAPITGVITGVRFEKGQVVAPGQPVVAIANDREPEIVVDVPEGHLETFRAARHLAALASSPTETFAVALRELSAQATAPTRTYRARLQPLKPVRLPLGASATLVAETVGGASSLAALPAAALSQRSGAPAVWVVRPEPDGASGVVELASVAVHGYRNDEVLVSGLDAGRLVVSAGVQKMAPGLRVALPAGGKALVAARGAP